MAKSLLDAWLDLRFGELPNETLKEESYRSIPLFGDPHDEPLKLSDEYLSICRKFDEARIICGYPVPTPPVSAGASEFKSIIWHEFNADGSERAEHCCGCWNFRPEGNRIVAVCNECGERREGHFPGVMQTAEPVASVDPRSAALSSAMRGDRPLDPYGRPS